MALPNKLAEEQSADIAGSAMGVSRLPEDIAVTIGGVMNESRNTGRLSSIYHELVERAGVLKQASPRLRPRRTEVAFASAKLERHSKRILFVDAAGRSYLYALPAGRVSAVADGACASFDCSGALVANVGAVMPKQSRLPTDSFVQHEPEALRRMSGQILRFVILPMLAIASCFAAAPTWADNLTDAFAAADYKKVLEIAMPRAEAGDVRAQTMVGSLYSYGRGVPQSYAKAEEWFRKAAEQGFAPGEYALGMFYRVGATGNRDDKVAFDWFKKAADQDNPEALLEVGHMYRDGLGVSPDPAKAADYQLRAERKMKPFNDAILDAFKDGQ